MNFFESILTGLDEARRHFGQTVLALLGIVLGTGSIVAVLALFGGQAAHTQEYLNEVGGVGTFVIANRDLPLNPTARALASRRVTYRDALALEGHATALAAINPVWTVGLNYRFGDRSFGGTVIGAVPAYIVINPIEILAGRYLSDLDVREHARVAVMGWKYADSLFGSATGAVGKQFSLGGERFLVVGVLTREEFRFASWEGNALEYRNERAYIPITTGIALFNADDRLRNLTVKARPGEMALAEEQVSRVLRATHGVEDFDIQPPGGRGASTVEFLTLFNYIFLVVGVVSLFTGGIVIANILLASVVERVREFGTRMALGATGVGVFTHVLAEALVVTLFGGALGLALGEALTGAVAHFMKMPAVVTPMMASLALGTAGIVGLTAGVFPALRAARLSPVEALRYG